MPSKVVPIVHLVFHFGHAVLLGPVPNATSIPVDSQKVDVSDRTVLKPLDAIDVSLLVPTLQANAYRQPFFLSFFGRGQNPVYARDAGSDGFFHEDLLALVDGVLELLGFEAWRSSDDDHVHAAVNRLLVSIQPVENLTFHAHLVIAELLLETCDSLLNARPFGKSIGHSHQLGVAFDSLAFLQVFGAR